MVKGCVIVETRILDFKKLFDNHFKYIPEDWKLTFFCSKENETYVELALEELDRQSCLVVLPQALTIGFNASKYNKLITSRGFWSNIPYEKVLVFQHDSKLLRDGIEKFIEYDFIGAPLYHIAFPMMNGGLSIRSKQAMIDVIDLEPYNESAHGNEDMYFCRGIKLLGGELPTKEIAMQFSVETIYFPTPIAVHSPEKYLKANQLKALGI